MKRIKRALSLLLSLIMLGTAIASTGMIAQASMLPLKEVQAYLVLNGMEEEELKSVPLANVLNGLVDSNNEKVTIAADATDVWMYVKDENNEEVLDSYDHFTINENSSMDLSTVAGVTSYTLELIVGSGGQLNLSNVRYIIKVYVTNSVSTEYSYNLYKQSKDGVRSEVVPDEKTTAVGDLIFTTMEATSYTLVSYDDTADYYLSMTETAEEHPNIKIKVYNGTAENLMFKMMGISGSNVTDITDKIMNQDMMQKDAGYYGDFTDPNNQNGFLLIEYVIQDWETGVEKTEYALRAFTIDTSYSKSNLYTYEDGQKKDVACFSAREAIVENMVINPDASVSDVSGIHGMYFMLDEGYSADQEYYIALELYDNKYGSDTFNHVEKAVIGSYASLDEAVNQEDIKQQLFAQNDNIGYKDNFNYLNNGKFFTVFMDYGFVWKCNVRVMEYDPKFDSDYIKSFTDKPIIGEADPWFRVTGATDNQGKAYDTYVIENGKSINMDTYYGYGYQTLFINDSNADLTQLKPNFWYANTDRVYAVSKDTGAKVEDNHVRDFSNENQQYTGVIIDNGKENNRNYWVTFKKLNNNGPELYVFGPNEREVILDEYFEYKHDVLIANIGNAPLEGLSVELKDAENVKLDPYWTVGGTNNDTLAPFTATSSNTKYGEIANIAKIRLLPDGDGEVKGTLIIKAKDQEPVLIELNGTAQQPEIVTETLSEAVKYVPYSHIVATNNIHDWNEVTFELYSGMLPDGVELNTQTGEIYGTPQEAGEYHFTVEAKYTYFEPSFVELTLNVKDNTNENVFQASDEGYAILDSIGEDANGDHNYVLKETGDQVFRSNGAFADFVDFWLNGEKLVEGVDYDVSEGSTRITVRSQTFEDKANQDGSNTIAAEFRTGGGDPDGTHEGELKRTAQNFTMDVQKSDPAVDNVIALINAIPDTVKLSDKVTVEKARAAYNALTDAQKNQVTNYDRLTSAEKAIATLEENERRDKAAANAVIAMIDSLPSTITLTDSTAVNNARSAYENLTAQQKAYVTNLNKLIDAENRLKELEAEEKEKAAINEVISLINAIPDSVTLKDKGAVEAARKAYDALTDAQKQGVINYDKLTDAERTISALEALEKADAEDKAAAKAVEDLIDKLPDTLTLSDKADVNAAREAYDALTDTQKNLVTNYADLEKAENTIAALEAYEKASEADKKVADKVISMIDELPDNLTLNDKEKVEAARKAYDALTEAQKQIVTNYSDLIEAEVAIAELENEDYQSNQYVTFIGRIVDSNGKPMANVIVELHSKVQTARTDSNGFFRFNMVEMGRHSLIAKDANGKVIASKDFSIVEGTPLSVTEDIITAENRSTFTVTVEAKGSNLTLKDLQEGDHTVAGGDLPDEPGININDSQGSISSPQTGDSTNLALWYTLLILSLSGLVVMAVLGRRRKSY